MSNITLEKNTKKNKLIRGVFEEINKEHNVKNNLIKIKSSKGNISSLYHIKQPIDDINPSLEEELKYKEYIKKIENYIKNIRVNTSCNIKHSDR